ncbi:hypothetical protein Tco_0509324 [Tanacetum coccineum]
MQGMCLVDWHAWIVSPCEGEGDGLSMVLMVFQGKKWEEGPWLKRAGNGGKNVYIRVGDKAGDEFERLANLVPHLP